MRTYLKSGGVKKRTQDSVEQGSGRFFTCLFQLSALLLLCISTEAQTIVSKETFPNFFNNTNPGFTAPAQNVNGGNFTGSTGTWSATSNTTATTVVLAAYYSAVTNALKLVNWNTTGKVASDCHGTSPVVNLSSYSCSPSVTMSFKLYTYSCNASDPNSYFKLECSADNGTTWTAEYSKSSAEIFNTWGANGLTTITIPLAANYRTATFRYRFSGYKPANQANNFYLFIDDPTITATAATCCNITNAGQISNNESRCGGFDPAVISSLVDPSGGTGTMDYVWYVSTDNFTSSSTIAGAISSSYDPGPITQTSWYRRGVKRGGCTQYMMSNTIVKTVNPLISVSLNHPVLNCLTSTAQLTPSTGISTASVYSWFPGNQTTANISISTSGTYAVRVQNSFGCFASDTITVSRDVTPPSITMSNPVVLDCRNTSAILTATVVPATNINYSWNQFGETTQSIEILDLGNYCVTVTNALNGCTASSCASVSKNTAPPLVQLNNPVITCAGPNVVLIASSSPNVEYNWNQAGETTSSISVSRGGTYCVSITNPVNGCMASACRTVTEDLRIPNLSVNDAVITCLSPAALLTTAATPGVTYRWSDGIQTSSAITVKAAGNYIVTATNPSNGCTASAMSTVVFQTIPMNLQMNHPVITCSQPVATLALSGVPASVPVQYSWSSGNRTTSTIDVVEGGTYCVTVSDPNNRCYNPTTVCASITMDLNAPKPKIKNAVLNCNNPTVTLSTDTAAIYQYEWLQSGQRTPTIQVSNTGNYCVRVTDISNGCASTVCGTVTADTSHPVVILNDAVITCSKPAAVLSAISYPSAGVSYTWSSNGFTNQSMLTSTAGRYCVKVTNQVNGCVNTACSNVTENKIPPAISVSSVNGTCLNGNVGSAAVQVISGTPPFTYAWSNASPDQSIGNLADGIYMISVKDANGCSASATTTIVNSVNCCVNVKDGGRISSDETQCGPFTPSKISSVSLPSGGTGVVEFQWQISTDNFITYTNIPGATDSVFTPASISKTTWYRRCARRNMCGNYIGESNIVMKQVLMPANVSIAANGPVTFCSGSSVGLCASGSGSVSWNTDETSTCITAQYSGLYTVELTTAEGCSASASIYIQVKLMPAVSISGTRGFCTGQVSNLCATSGMSSYLWNTGETSSCIQVQATGTYAVQVTNADGCSASAVIRTVAYPVPSIVISGPSMICPGQILSLCATSDGTSYAWNNNATTSCTNVTSPGLYQVTVTNAYGCSTTATKAIQTGTCATTKGTAARTASPIESNEIESLNIQAYPNPFKDQITISFQLHERASDVILEVFALDGSLVKTLFHDHAETGINYAATVDGSDLETGVYIYKFISEEKVLTGKIQLIK